MKGLKIAFWLLLVVILLGFMSSAQVLEKGRVNPADRGFGPGGRGPGAGNREIGPGGRNRIEALSKLLNLTTEQKTRLLEQDQALERDILPFRQKIETLSLKMEEEMNQDKPDRRKIEKYIKDINQNQLEIHLKRTDFMLNFRETLSADQKAKLKKMAGRSRLGK